MSVGGAVVGLFAVAPAAYLLCNVPAGMSSSTIGYLMSASGGNWTFLQNAGWALAMTVAQNWVTVLTILAVVFVAITVVQHLGVGRRSSVHHRKDKAKPRGRSKRASSGA